MGLPLAHAAGGYLAYEAVRPVGRHRWALLGLAVVAASAPDVDFVPGLLLGHPDAFHRGVTHTLVAAAAVGLAAALVARACGPGVRRLRVGRLVGLAWMSHLVVDLLTVDTGALAGIPVFWPLSRSTWISSTPVFGEITRPSGARDFFSILVGPGGVTVWLTEAAVLLTAVAGVHVARGLWDLLAGPDEDVAPEP